MKSGVVCLYLFFLFAATACFAKSYTIHIQSPWASDSAHYLTGGFSDWGANANTLMTSEGESWHSFTITVDGALTDWWTMTLTDGTHTWGPTPKVVDILGDETEVWIYTSTTDSSYTVSVLPPHAKVVWFKSPWGNKALPNMIHGLDTIRMRFVPNDTDHCGWFYAALTKGEVAASSDVYFQRAYLNETLPAKGMIDLQVGFDNADSVWVDGTSATLDFDIARLSTGTCFDSSRTLHIFHPWRSDATYKDSLVYLSVSNNILNQPTAMDSTGEYRYWFRYDFSPAMANSAEWSNSYAKLTFYSTSNNGETYPSVDSLKPSIMNVFPAGIYEVWLFPASDGSFQFYYSPLQEKVVRFLNPWENMTPSMLVDNDTVKMRSFSKDTCGWYEGVYYKTPSSWGVLFKQSLGSAIYSADGLTSGGLIALDSILALGDTVWVMPYPNTTSAPRFYSKYPGRLGVCPTLTISAMMLDWAGEARPDSVDIDFGGVYNGNAYTEVTFNGTVYKTCGGLVTGMVQDTLGAEQVPLRVDSLSFPWDKCSAGRELDKWFIPVVVAEKNGNSYTNATCHDIELSLDDDGFWLADISGSNAEGGFFPLDNFRYLDSANTVLNPKYDSTLQGADNYHGTLYHNYSFSMKIQAQFQYVKGQFFEFRGDDDVWVFINDRLVVDLGGVHNPEKGAVALDTLGLTEGETYPFRIFFSERNATGSNFKMRTSINLETEKSYYPVNISTTDGTIQYEIWQILKDKSLSCDLSSTGKVDTTLAASVFTLLGGSLGVNGVILNSGVNYGGITISENMASFVIDTNAIVAHRSLAPGTYYLSFYLASDPSLSSEISFTVPAYPLPNIAFADSLGNEIDADSVTLGEWAFVPYKVRVMIYYSGSLCNSGCDEILSLTTNDSLVFLDSSGNKISSITLSGGYATFFVMGTTTIVNGSFTVSGATVANELTWEHINFAEPPVPYLDYAEMHDRNGDGVADSLILKYSSALEGEDVPDSLAWLFADSTWHFLDSTLVDKYIGADSSIIITSDSLLSARFTGLQGSTYSGSAKTWFTYVPKEGTDSGHVMPFEITGLIADKIGPVLNSAVVTTKGENLSILTLVFSESLEENQIPFDSLFEFKIWREGVQRAGDLYVNSGSRQPGNYRYDVYFYDKNGALPSVGDSVRFAPGVGRDLSGNVPHINNPWVRIVGEQFVKVTSSTLINVEPELAPPENTAGTIVSSIPLEYTFAEAEDAVGLPGFLVRYDMSELLLTTDAAQNISLKDIQIVYESYYFTNLGGYVNSAKGSVSCADSIFNGDCTKHPGNLYFAWNTRSENGRLAGTGAYIAKFDFKIKVAKTQVAKKSESAVWGIQRISK